MEKRLPAVTFPIAACVAAATLPAEIPALPNPRRVGTLKIAPAPMRIEETNGIFIYNISRGCCLSDIYSSLFLFIIMIQLLNKINSSDKKSIPYNWFKENGILIPYRYQKKVDYLKVIDEYILEEQQWVKKQKK